MSSGGWGWARPVVPGCASLLACLVLTPSNVVMKAAITTTVSATAWRLFRSLFMTSLLRQRTPLDGWGSSAGRLAADLTAQYLTDPAECHAWLSAPWDEAYKLQRPLPDGALKSRPAVNPWTAMRACPPNRSSCRRRFWLNKSSGRVRLDHASLLRPIDHSRNVVRMLAATLAPEHCSSGHCGKLCRWSHLISSAKGQRNCLAHTKSCVVLPYLSSISRPPRRRQLNEHEQDHQSPEKAGRDGPIRRPKDSRRFPFRADDNLGHGLSSSGRRAKRAQKEEMNDLFCERYRCQRCQYRQSQDARTSA
jgi:hypothetical protein